MLSWAPIKRPRSNDLPFVHITKLGISTNHLATLVCVVIECICTFFIP